VVCLLVLSLALLVGCGDRVGGGGDVSGFRGDPVEGAAAMDEFGCSACHTIPGIRGANAAVGPPLDFWARRVYIAGRLLNSEQNTIDWVLNPQGIEPGTAMPLTGAGPQDAENITAYLFTLIE
jgi:cytochrome c2